MTDHRGRLDRLRARFDEHGIDALLITTPSNRRWISGFTGTAGTLLVTVSGPVPPTLIVPGLKVLTTVGALSAVKVTSAV